MRRTVSALCVLLAACVAAPVTPRPLTRPHSCRAVLPMRGALPVEFLVPDRWSDDRPRLDRWCAAVGRAIAFSAAGSRRGPPAFDSLLVVSWNNGVGQGDLQGFIGWIRAQLRHRGWGPDQFVLLTQEVFSNRTRAPAYPPLWTESPRAIGGTAKGHAASEVVRVARRERLSLFYAPSMRNGERMPARGPEDRGNAILTPLRLEELQAVELPFEAQRRVAQTAMLRGRTTSGSRWCLRIVNAHLDNRAGRWGKLGYVNPWGRERQLSGLLEVLDPNIPTVLAGDLNTMLFQRSSPALRRLEARFPRSTIEGPRLITSGRWPLGVHLDHMAFDLPTGWHGELPMRIDDDWGSDHYPIMGWIGIPSRGGCQI